MSRLSNLKKDLKAKAKLANAKALARYFKTGPGEYGEGDIFLGLKTAETRQVAKKYPDLSPTDLKKLLASKMHEERTVALMILTRQFAQAPLAQKKALYQFYLRNLGGVNNWDLVDTSAPEIVGAYLDLTQEPRDILYQLAYSANLWERRVAMLATYYFIKKNQFTDTLKIAKILLKDKEDLIHKAVGWMLREVGKRDLAAEEAFLHQNYRKMPRTMLRYAIEKFPEAKRQAYLSPYLPNLYNGLVWLGKPK